MSRCYLHEDREALYECDYCGKTVCGDCMRYIEDEEEIILCPDCTAETILSNSTEDIIYDEIEKTEIQKGIRSIGKMKIQQVMNSWLLVLLFLAIGTNFFINRHLVKSIPQVEMKDWSIQQAGNPVLEMSLYLQGIFKYASDHNGKYPNSLESLYPKYINKELPTVLATDDKYSFAADINNGFVLSCSVADRFGFKKMYATREGVIKID